MIKRDYKGELLALALITETKWGGPQPNKSKLQNILFFKEHLARAFAAQFASLAIQRIEILGFEP